MLRLTLLPLLLLFSCIAHSDNKQQTRLFAIAITPPEIKRTEDFWPAYEHAFNLAIETGIDLPGELAFTWSKIEHKSLFGKISYRDDNTINIIQFIKQKKLPVVITLQPFETANSRIPKDLQSLPYDHPEVVQRFKDFIDWVYQVTEGLVPVSIVFGNEFDIHLALSKQVSPQHWQQLDNLIRHCKTYIKTLPRWRDVPFALEATYAGLTGAHWQALQKLNQQADIVGVSYYPIVDDKAQEPSVLGDHLNTLFDIYPDKQIDFYQFGYPSSEAINGSEEKQRKFIAETFKYWDLYPEKIRIITFTWLYELRHDLIEQTSGQVLGELSPTQAFFEFIGSLGLHSSKRGDEKPAFKELKKQLARRDWNS